MTSFPQQQQQQHTSLLFILPTYSVASTYKLFFLKFELLNTRIFITSHNHLDIDSINNLDEFIQPPTILQRTTYLRCAKNISDNPTFEYDNDNKIIKYNQYKKHNHLYILIRNLTFISLQLY